MEMKKSNNILYIGNNLTKRSKYNSTMNTLSMLLSSEGYKVKKASNKKNKVFRLLDMLIAVSRNYRKADYILIDTFSTQNFYYAVIVSQLSRILKKKYIPILHGGNLPERIHKSKFLSNLIFNNSYLNIAPSMYLKTHFDGKGYKTKYIPNTIEINEYPFKERKIITPNILWVRAFDKTYNPQLAIEVLNILKTKFPEIKLCMVGPVKDDSFEACKKLVSKYSLETSITFTGVLKKEEWHKLSVGFDVFINTTNIDNTPVSVIEAMALGIPIVSTNVGGIPFLIENQKEGILVPKNNAKAMSNAIINLLEEKNPNMTKNARNKVENFDWNEVKEKWNAILM